MANCCQISSVRINNCATLKNRACLLLLSISVLSICGCKVSTEEAPKIVKGRIAFNSQRLGHQGIYLYENGNIRAITKNYGGHPRFSANGKKIYFRITGAIYEYDIASETVTKLEQLNKYKPDQFDLSPDTAQIVFSSWGSEKSDKQPSNIYIAALNGNSYRQITHFEGYPFAQRQGGANYPRWSPDGKMIMFLGPDGRNRGSNEDTIYTINADGSDLRRIIGRESGVVISSLRSPSWSPDNKKIIFDGCPNGESNLQLFITNADGSGLHQITNMPYNYFDPVFSSDGQHILCASLMLTRSTHVSSGAALYILDLDGKNETQVTKPEMLSSPWWPFSKAAYSTDSRPDWFE